jgi:hypothetical protein
MVRALRYSERCRLSIFSFLGSKTYITNGGLSDVVIVCAKTDPNAKGSKAISLFLVDANTPGFKKGRLLNKVGMKVPFLSMQTTNTVVHGIVEYLTACRHKTPLSSSSKTVLSRLQRCLEGKAKDLDI